MASLSLTLIILVASSTIINFQTTAVHAAASSSSSAATSSSPIKPLNFNNTTSSSVYKTFLDKFEGRGPTLTVTLRDPSTISLSSGSSSDRNSKSNHLVSKLQKYRDTNTVRRRIPQEQADDGTFGISSKLAALFHITPSTPVSNGKSNLISQFSDGYMMDGGEVLLGPPSETAIEGTTTGGLFPLGGLLSGLNKLSRNWSDCIGSVHPEMRYEILTRDDTKKPFKSLPWLSSASCGIAWRPIPLRYPGQDHHHNGINSPHYFRCGASLSLPRISNLWKNFTSNKQVRLKARDLDIGLTCRDTSPSSSGGKTVELLLGRTRPSMPPPGFYGSAARIKSILKSDAYRRNNHLLIRLATNGSNGAKLDSKLSTIQYARASLRLSTPSFLRRFRNSRGKGVTVMPSYDFIEEKARCVLSGDVGTTGRTRAVLRLDVDDSTLTLVRALDGNKIIAPTISLQSGKIVYDYHLELGGGDESSSQRKIGSSLRAHVDPSKGVILKWTDGVSGGGHRGSCWVTECRVPLGVTASGPMTADVRVGRRWVM